MNGDYALPTAIVLFGFAAMFAYSGAAGLWVLSFPKAGRPRITLFDKLTVLALAGIALVFSFTGLKELGVL